MKDLIERLEKLDGPCRECDAEIMVACLGYKWERGNTGRLIEPGTGHVVMGRVNLTESIDAALTLHCGRDEVTIVIGGTRGGFCKASDIHNLDGVGEWKSEHKSTAIAICIAALRPRQSIIDGER